MSVRFVKPDNESLDYVIKHMRKADVIEVMSSHGMTPRRAVMTSVEQSQLSSVALIDDVPCAVFGIVVRNVLTGTGVPWLLGTDLIFKHHRQFIEYTRVGIDEMLELCPRLTNRVHADNHQSIRWLRHMGFSFSTPEPWGVKGQLFIEFYKVAKCVLPQ